VYVIRDLFGRVVYVGKALNLRRRLAAHFADRRWRSLPPEMARTATVECQPLGSELEALLREAELIRQLEPLVNVQTAPPSLETRAIAESLSRDTVVFLPAVDPESATLVGARAGGSTLVQETPRYQGDVSGVATALWTFFEAESGEQAGGVAPLVFSWLAGRGQRATRLDPHEFDSAASLGARIERLLRDKDLFGDRLVAI
jgi:hypothetical protein